MKKALFIGLFAIGALTTISVSASNQEPTNENCCPQEEQCNPAPCDTVCPVTNCPATPVEEGC